MIRFLLQIAASPRLPLSVSLILQIAAFWAVWQWYAGRVWSSDGEIWSLLALAAAVGLCFFKIEKAKIIVPVFLPTIFILLYAASFAFAAPPIVRAVLAVTVIALTLSQAVFGRILHSGLTALLFLSLPVAASLNFFLGFPLRVVVGEATAFLLRLNGLAVWREGVCLHFGEQLIAIDAPCAGVKMLWFGLFLTAVLVGFWNFNLWRSALAFGAAFGLILLGNVARASALFYTETGIVNAPAWTHEGVGVFAFLLVAGGIAATAHFLRQMRKPARCKCVKLDAPLLRAGFRINLVLILACLLATFAPFLAVRQKLPEAAANFRPFPAEFENMRLTELELSEREKIFLTDFPGKVGRFSDGRREIIFRRVTEATRKLHPASDCFAGIGYRTKPLPMRIDADGNRWGCFAATRRDESLRVCERIYTPDNAENWTDVSAWYWAAVGADKGEWFAVTVAEAMNTE